VVVEEGLEEQMVQTVETLEAEVQQIGEGCMAVVVEVNRMITKTHPDVMEAVEQFALFGPEQQDNSPQQIQVIYRRKKYVILN
jgi:hypothetical protein